MLREIHGNQADMVDRGYFTRCYLAEWAAAVTPSYLLG